MRLDTLRKGVDGLSNSFGSTFLTVIRREVQKEADNYCGK